MPDDMPTAEPDLAQWWLRTLSKQLLARQKAVALYERYYRGDHPVFAELDRAQEAYRRLLRRSRSNWMGLVVDAVAERLTVDGFRFGDTEGGDSDAWKIWQVNQLDADSGLIHTTALTTGCSYALVWRDEVKDRAQITVEHPSQVIVAYEPGLRRERAAALKVWIDRDRWLYANVYLPNAIYKFCSRVQLTSTTQLDKLPTLRELDTPGESWPLVHKLGVPIVEFQANPTMLDGGVSEIADVIDIQDRINETLFQRLLAAQFGAFRQRYATGIELPEDSDGNPIEPFNAAADRLWTAEDADVKFGEFSESDLKGYISSVESDVQHLAAITRTPPHYLLGQSGAFPSGDSLKATETGLVAKVKNHQLYFGESWEEVIRLALKVTEDPRAGDEQSEVIWHDPESRSQGELVDALVKMSTLGVPAEVLWERWGASPQEVARWRKLRAAQALFTPPPTPPPDQPPTAGSPAPTPPPPNGPPSSAAA